jgi:hypothetical protein
VGRFFVNDYYAFKKERKIRDQCYVLCFLLCVVDNGVSDGAGQWCETTRGIGNSKLRTLAILFLSC